jgi:hypothetical protein
MGTPKKEPTQRLRTGWAKGGTAKMQGGTTKRRFVCHGGGLGLRYGFCSWLRNGGGGLGQFGHKNVGELHLYGRRDATLRPVLDTLDRVGAWDIEHPSEPCCATIGGNQLPVSLNCCIWDCCHFYLLFFKHSGRITRFVFASQHHVFACTVPNNTK